MLLYSDLPSGLPTEMLIFGLLTFAPRKNPPDGGNLTLLRYHVTTFALYKKAQDFARAFLKKVLFFFEYKLLYFCPLYQ